MEAMTFQGVPMRAVARFGELAREQLEELRRDAEAIRSAPDGAIVRVSPTAALFARLGMQPPPASSHSPPTE